MWTHRFMRPPLPPSLTAHLSRLWAHKHTNTQTRLLTGRAAAAREEVNIWGVEAAWSPWARASLPGGKLRMFTQSELQCFSMLLIILELFGPEASLLLNFWRNNPSCTEELKYLHLHHPPGSKYVLNKLLEMTQYWFAFFIISFRVFGCFCLPPGGQLVHLF